MAEGDPGRVRAAQVILTLDLDTFQLSISGSVPTHEIALYMREQGATAAREMLARSRTKRVLSVADLSAMARE